MSAPASSNLDCLVVGDGLVGWAVAYELTRIGRHVAVVTGNVPGSASAAAAGMITPGTVSNLSPEYLPLAIAAMAHYPDLIAQLEASGSGPTGYSQPGGLVIARTPDELIGLDQIERDLATRRDLGLGMIGEIRRVSPAECREVVPVLSPDLAGGVWYSGGAQVDGRDLRSAIRASAIAMGADVVPGEAHLQRVGDRIHAVLRDGSVRDAEAVVMATGAWSAPLLAPIGIGLPIHPQRGQLLHLDWQPAGEPWPVVETMGHHYLLRFADRIVIGATREDAGFAAHPTPRGVQDVLDHALAFAPELASTPILETRVGLRPVTPDGLPILGRLPGTSNAWICAGHGPLGLTLGPWTAAMLASAICGGLVEPPLAPYAPDRFIT